MGGLTPFGGNRIDVDQLTPGELKLLLSTYEGLVEILRAANNTLILKLSAAPGFSAEHTEILNDWSAFHNCLFEHHAHEVEKRLESAGGLH